MIMMMKIRAQLLLLCLKLTTIMKMEKNSPGLWPSGVLDNQYVSKSFFVDGMFTSITVPRDLWARQPSCQWWSRALGVVFLNFFSPPFFVWKIEPVSDGFWDRFGTENGPQINQKSIKTCFLFVAFFAMRFFFVFLIFLLNFRGLRT